MPVVVAAAQADMAAELQRHAADMAAEHAAEMDLPGRNMQPCRAILYVENTYSIYTCNLHRDL